MVATAFVALLKDEFELVGVVHDGRTLVAEAQRVRPDVIVTDLSMPMLNGIDAIRQIKTAHPNVRIIVLTMHRDTQLAAEAFRAGASGYLLKVSPADELVKAIDEVSQGRAYVTSLLTEDLITFLMQVDRRPREDVLTPRQREVLQLIAEGRTMKEVAHLLKISPRTAETHKYEIMQALGVKTTAALIQYAVRLNLVPE